MRKTTFLAAALPLVSIGMLIAKPQSNSSPTKDVSSVRGCLKASTSGFILEARDGTMYAVSGDSSEVTKLLGREVEVRGKATVVSTALAGHLGETTKDLTEGAVLTIEAQSATQIADHCGK